MTHQKVLVVYGTKYGSTAEIAAWIADVLNEHDFDADAIPAGTAPDPRDYAAVVLGAGLYAGRWHRDATRYARRHRTALRDMPVWLFSSGPLDSSASVREIPPVPGVARIATRLGARGHTTFGGCLGESATGFIARRIVSSGHGGDFRDRKSIDAWAGDIADELAAHAPPA
ncbi:flavodoxin domain-containing protein [Streptomyces sp. NPDC051940]|uniref:flavodoxin domain-containing protein n=1 Tax=Streptomyces sp. NPDC051940 TaxID=3155675 RepID=UPI003425A966